MQGRTYRHLDGFLVQAPRLAATIKADAYFTVDPNGTEFAGGGLNLTLRDLARFGEMMRLRGTYNGRQIVPASVIDDIRRGGNREQFAPAGYKTLPGWSYRNMWWISHNTHEAFAARGSISTQRLKWP